MRPPQTTPHIATAILFVVLSMSPLPSAADKDNWRPVKGPAIRALLKNSEFGDGVHFAYRFNSDGTFSGTEMGRAERGTWRVVKDEMCWKWTQPQSPEECYGMQQDGTRVRLMLNGTEAWYGALQKAR